MIKKKNTYTDLSYNAWLSMLITPTKPKVFSISYKRVFIIAQTAKGNQSFKESMQANSDTRY